MATEPGCDLRVAVTMNGGVSLAVYIGGCAHELNLLANDGHSSPLSTLARKLGYRPVVDVIAGTSAGGINGVALALALSAPGTDLSQMRGMWIQTGSMESLLRRPFESGPPSLLKGSYLLTSIEEALTLFAPQETTPPAPPPPTPGPPPGESVKDPDVSLLVTTTLLNPVGRRTTDSAGTTLYDESHEGVFRFDIHRGTKLAPETIKRMALAARATASFPVAFEPAFLPVSLVNPVSPAKKSEYDLQDHAQWADRSGADPPADRSRYGVDGGLLANTPTQHTLSAIRSHAPTGRSVRRLLLLVHPHAPANREDPPADSPDRQLTLTAAMAKIVGASGSLGSRRYIDAIAEHNSRATRWRDSRSALLKAYTSWAQLERSINGATPQWTMFREFRAHRLAYVVAQSYLSEDLPFPQRFESASAVVEARKDAPDGLPWVVPKEPPSPTGGAWNWGFDLAVNITIHVGYITEAIPRDSSAAVFSRSATARETLLSLYGQLIAERSATVWNRNDPYKEILDSFRDFARTPVANYRTAANAESFGNFGLDDEMTVAEAMTRILTQLSRELLAMVNTPPAPAAPYGYLFSGIATDKPDECLRRLLVVEIVGYIHSEYGTADNTVPTTSIDLFQVSGQVTHSFAPTLTTDAKLAGMELGRLGGFLKKSWRANDWIWGRLDTIKILTEALITPDALRRLDADLSDTVEGADERAKAILATLAGFDFADMGGDLRPLRDKAKSQLKAATAATSPRNLDVKAVVGLVATVIQTDVIHQEAPELLACILADEEEGATSHRGAALKSSTFEDDAGNSGLLPRYAALTRFAGSGLGAEPLFEQSHSDLFIRTSATALATAATTLTSEKSGLNVAKPVTVPVRAVAAVIYWVAAGLAGAGRNARFLAALVLAAGVGLSAVSLMSGMNPLVSTLAAGVGIGSVAAVLAYAAMRTGTIVHSAAILGIYLLLVPLTGYRVTHPPPAANGTEFGGVESGIAGALTVAAVLILVAGALVVANINEPRPRVGRVAKLRAWSVPVLCAGLAAIIALIPIDLTTWHVLARTGDWISAQWVAHWPVILPAGVVAVLLPAVLANVPPRVLRDDPRADPDRQSASWARIYALCYVLFGGAVTAALIAGEATDDRWLLGIPIAAFVVSAALGILMPYLIWRGALRRLEHPSREGEEKDKTNDDDDDDDE